MQKLHLKDAVSQRCKIESKECSRKIEKFTQPLCCIAKIAPKRCSINTMQRLHIKDAVSLDIAISKAKIEPKRCNISR